MTGSAFILYGTKRAMPWNGVSLAQTRATRGPRNTRNSSWVFCTGRGLDLAEILPQHDPNLTQLLMDAIREARV